MMDCADCGRFLVVPFGGGGENGSLVKAWLGQGRPMVAVARVMTPTALDVEHGVIDFKHDPNSQRARSGLVQ